MAATQVMFGEEYQREAWHTLKESIDSLVENVSVDNIPETARKLFELNLIRGRGLVCKALMNAQSKTPSSSHIYGTLAAVCNTEFPEICLLLAKRLIAEIRLAFRLELEPMGRTSLTFIAHLFNQNVIDDHLPCQIVNAFLECPTNYSVKMLLVFLNECGPKFERNSIDIVPFLSAFCEIRYLPTIDEQVKTQIEALFARWTYDSWFRPVYYLAVKLVPEEKQILHKIDLYGSYDLEFMKNYFEVEENFETNEQKYAFLKKLILADLVC